MALISSIGAGIYTTLKYTADSAGTGETLPTDNTSHGSFLNASTASVNGTVTLSDTTITVDTTSGSIFGSGTITAGSEAISYTSFSRTSATAGIFTVPALTADQVTAFADNASVAVSATTLTNVNGVREFPSFGAPANIVNVPVYGQAVSDQIGGQSDAPALEFTVNYVPSDHAALQALVTSGTRQVFQIRLANAEAAGSDDAVFYIKGTVASLLVSPNLTDSNQATISVATAGEYVGPFAS